LTEPSVADEYTIDKKLESANKRIAVAENNEEVVLNESKGPSITDQVGRGAQAQAAILEAFKHPVFTTSSDIHIPKKRSNSAKAPNNSKKRKILKKLQFE